MSSSKRFMTEEHKQAIAAGRSEGLAVRRYLESLQAASRPGRRVSVEELRERLKVTVQAIETEDDPLARLELIQDRIDLERRIEAAATENDFAAAESAFILVARHYAERKSISYQAFREAGVPASVLKAAGIRQTRSTRGQSSQAFEELFGEEAEEFEDELD